MFLSSRFWKFTGGAVAALAVALFVHNDMTSAQQIFRLRPVMPGKPTPKPGIDNGAIYTGLAGVYGLGAIGGGGGFQGGGGGFQGGGGFGGGGFQGGGGGGFGGGGFGGGGGGKGFGFSGGYGI